MAKKKSAPAKKTNRGGARDRYREWTSEEISGIATELTRFVAEYSAIAKRLSTLSKENDLPTVPIDGSQKPFKALKLLDEFAMCADSRLRRLINDNRFRKDG